MATKKYRIDTDKGSFEVEVNEPDPPINVEREPKSLLRRASDWLTSPVIPDQPGRVEGPVTSQDFIDNPKIAMGRAAESILHDLTPANIGLLALGGAKSQPGQFAASQIPRLNIISGLRTAARGAGGLLTDFDITHPTTLAGKSLKWMGKEPTPPPRFTDLPLSQQQKYLPQTPGPERRSVPPTQAEPTPFHQKPLFQQMENLPQRPAPDVRTPMPSHVPQGTMNDLPLYKQQEILEKFGAKPAGESMRTGGPIASGHEVESLLDRYRPNVSGSQVGGGSPASPSSLGAKVPVEGMVGEGSSAPAAISPVASHLQPEGPRLPIETDEFPHGLVSHSFHRSIGDLNQGMRAGQPGPLDELLLRILREGK